MFFPVALAICFIIIYFICSRIALDRHSAFNFGYSGNTNMNKSHLQVGANSTISTSYQVMQETQFISNGSNHLNFNHGNRAGVKFISSHINTTNAIVNVKRYAEIHDSDIELQGGTKFTVESAYILKSKILLQTCVKFMAKTMHVIDSVIVIYPSYAGVQLPGVSYISNSTININGYFFHVIEEFNVKQNSSLVLKANSVLDAGKFSLNVNSHLALWMRVATFIADTLSLAGYHIICQSMCQQRYILFN